MIRKHENGVRGSAPAPKTIGIAFIVNLAGEFLKKADEAYSRGKLGDCDEWYDRALGLVELIEFSLDSKIKEPKKSFDDLGRSGFVRYRLAAIMRREPW